MKSKVKAIAKINQTRILLIEGKEKRVAIRPICDALGISVQGQLEKIKNDEILKSTVKEILTVGADEKERPMVSIPFMFVFGWLFTIKPNKVKPEARETVLKYKLECYKVLYYHFTKHGEFLEQKQEALVGLLDGHEGFKSSFKNAKTNLADSQKKINAVKTLTFEEWEANDRQVKMDF